MFHRFRFWRLALLRHGLLWWLWLLVDRLRRGSLGHRRLQRRTLLRPGLRRRTLLGPGAWWRRRRTLLRPGPWRRTLPHRLRWWRRTLHRTRPGARGLPVRRHRWHRRTGIRHRARPRPRIRGRSHSWPAGAGNTAAVDRLRRAGGAEVVEGEGEVVDKLLRVVGGGPQLG